MNQFTPLHRFIVAGVTTAVMFNHPLDVRAASDTWNQPGGTLQWTDPANWLSGTQYPNGSGDVASFTNDITSAQTVNVTQAVTVGTINLGDSAGTINNFTIGTATQTNLLDNGASANVINNLVGANTILSRLVATGANKDLTVNVSGGSLTFGTATTQSPWNIDTLTKNGSGTLNLGTSGGVVSDLNVAINGGKIAILGNDSLPTNAVVTMQTGALLVSGGGRNQHLAEIRGNGTFNGQSGGQFVVGNNVARAGETIANNGVLRPGDTNGFNQIGGLSIGFVGGGEATAPQFDPGSRCYFDIASYTSFDTINSPRVVTTINGGDIYITFLNAFSPTNNAQFRLIIDNSTRGMKDGNGGALFDNIYMVNANNATNLWTAVIGDAVLASENPGGLDGRNVIFTYIPEPNTVSFIFFAIAALWARRRNE